MKILGTIKMYKLKLKCFSLRENTYDGWQMIHWISWSNTISFQTLQWMSDCCFTPTQEFFSYIMARTSQLSMRWRGGLICTRSNCLVESIYTVLAHWNNSSRIDMSSDSDTLSWFRANQTLVSLLNIAGLGKKQKIPFL
jgi:hypothetical protein